MGHYGVQMSHVTQHHGGGEGKEASLPGKEASRGHEEMILVTDSQEMAQLIAAWSNKLDVSFTNSSSGSSTRHLHVPAQEGLRMPENRQTVPRVS